MATPYQTLHSLSARDSVLEELITEGSRVGARGVLLSLVGLACADGPSPSLPLLMTLLEVIAAVVRGQWPAAWGSSCLQLAGLIQVRGGLL